MDNESSDDPATRVATMNDQMTSKKDAATDQPSKAKTNKSMSQDVSKRPSDTEVEEKAADDRSNTEVGHGDGAAKKRGIGFGGYADSDIELIKQLWVNGDICVEFKSVGNATHYFCSLCNYSTSLEISIRSHFCDDKDHKIMVKRLQYSMLRDATPWPFHDGLRFFNSISAYKSANGDVKGDQIFEFSKCIIKSHKVGVGRIFQRLEVTKAQRDRQGKFLWCRDTWCEWLGTENHEIPTEGLYTNYPVAILAFLYSSPVRVRTTNEDQNYLRTCSICMKLMHHERHCATLVETETRTLLCTPICKTNPHMFHVSCLVNWILAVEFHVLKGPDFESENTVRHFCPACTTCTKGRVSSREMDDVLKTVRQYATQWAEDFVKLKNNSTGLSFGCFHVCEDTEVKDIAWKCIDFYEGLGRDYCSKKKLRLDDSDDEGAVEE